VNRSERPSVQVSHAVHKKRSNAADVYLSMGIKIRCFSSFLENLGLVSVGVH
jgi:hypothetical protein